MVWFYTIWGSRVVGVGGEYHHKEVGRVYNVRRINARPFSSHTSYVVRRLVLSLVDRSMLRVPRGKFVVVMDL